MTQKVSGGSQLLIGLAAMAATAAAIHPGGTAQPAAEQRAAPGAAPAGSFIDDLPTPVEAR